MSYRDALQATRARADAAEEERSQAQAVADAAEGRAQQLQQELLTTKQEAEELRAALRARGPREQASPRPKDDLERQLAHIALDTHIERDATRRRRQRPYAIAALVVMAIAAFLLVTRLYDPLLEFLIDDLWGR
jgi:hypothetical protein